MRLTLLKPVKSTRQCGECTACCTTVAVAALNKPINVPCPHICSSGCEIYPTRPDGCRTFRCAWHFGLLPEKFRPDQSGIVWSFQESAEPNRPLRIAAFMLVDPIPLAQVEYQLAKIQQNVANPLVCQIIPRGMTCQLFGSFSCKQIKPNIWIAEQEIPPISQMESSTP